MYKIVGGDQKEYGPVSAEQVLQWIREGRANAETRVQVEGSADWKPLSSLAEFAAEFPPLTLPLLTSAPSPAPAPAIDTQAMLTRDYQLSIGACVSRGWQLMRSWLGLLIGATLLVMIISLGCAGIPVLGGIAGLIISGPLYGGLYWLFLKAIRRQATSVGDIFAGFSQNFVQLMLAQIVVSILTMLSGIVAIAAVAIAIMFGAGYLASDSNLPLPLMLVLIIVGLAGFVPAIYLAVSWTFTLPLVIDKKLDFWPAMELSRKKVGQHWWKVFGLIIVGALIAAVGLLACIVGFVFTLPLFIAVLMYAYEDIFSASAAPTA
jgi:uncharacterized membrane protein